jgi:DNA-binding winged helix-turn-helix (wHTH) protein
MLLLNAGRVVTASTLMDALWGEDLPGNAANALHGRISRLHRALADAGLPDALVATRRPGYLADADPERVDAHGHPAGAAGAAPGGSERAGEGDRYLRRGARGGW